MSVNRKTLIAVISFLISGILLIVFALFPLFKEIQENSRQLLAFHQELLALSREEEQYQKQRDIYQKYQSELAALERVFVNPDVPLELIGFLEGNALTSRLQMEIASMVKRTERGDVRPSLLIQLSLQGFFPDFLSFLERLEQGPYLIEVLDLTAREYLENENISINMSIKVFTR